MYAFDNVDNIMDDPLPTTHFHQCSQNIYIPAKNARQLRSSNSQLRFIPRLKTNNMGSRSFSVATLWNTLPDSVKSANTVMTICRHIKTYLFHLAYPPYRFNSRLGIC